MDDFKSQSTHLKVLYFVFFVGIGFAVTYATIFYKHTLTNPDGSTADSLIGWIYFAMPLVGILANIPAGIFADRLHLGRHLITFFCFGLALFSALVGLAGSSLASTFGLWPKFIYIFCVLIFFNIFFMPISPTIDAQTMMLLNKFSKRESYGVIRVWGTLGWSVSAIVMGYILHIYYHLPIIFYGAALAFLLLGLFSTKGLKASRPSKPVRIPWSHLKKDRLFLWYLVFALLNGILSTSSFLYTSYFFDDVMETPLQMGLIFGTWTLFEIPIMIYSKKLIRLLGNRWLLVCGLLLNGIRLVLFSLFTLETPFYWKWSAALLQGAAFGFIHLGTIDFVDRQSHENMRTTYMSLSNVARMTIASSLGGKLGAWIIAGWGADALMEFCGFGSIALILFFIIFVKGHAPVGSSTT